MKSAALLLVALLILGAVALTVWWIRPTERSDGSVLAERSAPGDGGRDGAEIDLPPPGPAAPEGVVAGALDTPLQFGAGHSISVLVHRGASMPDGESVLVTDRVELEVCAGERQLVGGALPAAFALGYPVRGGRFDLRAGASSLDVDVRLLATGLRGETVPADSCRRGWVVFVLGPEGSHDHRVPTSLVFDNTAFGFVPEADRIRHAWRLPTP